MFKRVSGWKFLLLGYFTFGLYPLYIWHKMAKNLRKLARKTDLKPIRGYFTAMLLGCITFGIYPIVWIFRFFALASALNEKLDAGIVPSCTFVMFLMGCIPIYSFFWLANMNNALIDAYKG